LRLGAQIPRQKKWGQPADVILSNRGQLEMKIPNLSAAKSTFRNSRLMSLSNSSNANGGLNASVVEGIQMTRRFIGLACRETKGEIFGVIL